MSQPILKKGSKVSWQWGSGEASGVIEEVYLEEITKTIKGKSIKRQATKENPAYYIKENDKNAHVLKLRSELQN